jgi:hypothetical protein
VARTGQWIVIASAFGDPFVADISETACPVLFAPHGAGSWRARRIAPSVRAFIACLTALESVLLGEFRRDVWDDAGLRRDFSRSLQVNLAAILPGGDAANFLSVLE